MFFSNFKYDKYHIVKADKLNPIIFEKIQPLSLKFLNIIEVMGKKVIPKNNNVIHHLKTKRKFDSNIIFPKDYYTYKNS